jgi:hypothetical protein
MSSEGLIVLIRGRSASASINHATYTVQPQSSNRL